jgi:hypothetical protein
MLYEPTNHEVAQPSDALPQTDACPVMLPHEGVMAKLLRLVFPPGLK